MKSSKLLALGLVICSANAHAQVLGADTTKPAENTTVQVGGKSTIDLIRLESNTPSVPLRNDGVVKGSEQIELDGKPLTRGRDYAIDYPTGIVMLMVPYRPGQALRATYRYDKSLAKPTGGATGLNSLKLDLMQGTSVSLGLGMVDRGANGTVTTTDLYSLRTNFSGGSALGFKSSGLISLGNKRESSSMSVFSKEAKGKNSNLGQGSAIVQDIAMKLAGGGQISANYQNIDQNYIGQQGFTNAGFSEKDANALAKERGLKRFSYGLNQVNFGGLKVSQGFDMVGDGDNEISRRNFGIETNGFKAGFNTRSVDKNFKRFKDLKDADGAIMAFETGTDTSDWFTEFTGKRFLMKMTGKTVENENQDAFTKRMFSLNYDKVKFSYGDQSIDEGYRHFQGTREGNWKQLERERGMSRRGWGLELQPISKQFSALAITSDSFGGNNGDLNALDIRAAGETWSLEHYERSLAKGFQDLINREDRGRLDQHVANITKMYEPAGVGARPEDVNWFSNGAGLERDFSRIQFNPGKGVGVRFDSLQFSGATDTGSRELLAITAGKTNFGFSQQRFGQNLTEVSTLMSFERERLGNVLGMNKRDIWLSTPFAKSGKLDFSMMKAETDGGTVGRTSIDYSQPNLDFKWRSRQVDAGFGDVRGLVDRDREVLQQLVGNEQRQLMLNWLMRRDLRIQLDWVDQENENHLANLKNYNTLLNWNPDKNSKLEYFQRNVVQRDGETVMSAESIERLLLARNFAGLGSVSWEKESANYSGELNTTPDRVRNTFAMSAKVDEKTTLGTEQTRTDFSNGNRENISTNTVSTEVIKGSGVSVSDTAISRTGTGAGPDERKRNYGVWVDLGRGMKLKYGYARALNENEAGNLSSNFSISEGTFGGVRFGGTNYQFNRIDGRRNKAIGNFNLSAEKGFDLGILDDFKFSLSSDSSRDYGLWQKENMIGRFSGSINGNRLGFEYFGQYVPQARQRAIDRGFFFATKNSANSLFGAEVNYKVRTLPEGKTFDIRNVKLSSNPIKGWKVTHELQSYPEVPRGDVLLGSVLQPTRNTIWRIDQTAGKNTLFGASWEERLNDQQKIMTRTTGVNLTLNANKPNPISIFYGVEQGDRAGIRTTAMRYTLKYDMVPGPNSSFGLLIGNVSWLDSDGQSTNIGRENWTMRLNWQVKF